MVYRLLGIVTFSIAVIVIGYPFVSAMGDPSKKYEKPIVPKVIESNQLDLSLPELPDISGYTHEAILAKRPTPAEGKVVIATKSQEPGLQKFLQGKRLAEFRELQGVRRPQAIKIESGVYTLPMLYDAVNNRQIFYCDCSDTLETYYARLPVYVAPGATLILESQSHVNRSLRLVKETGSYLATAGDLFVLSSEISGWSAKNEEFAIFEEGADKEFRPFIVTWTGSHTYMSDSRIQYMGYSRAKSYGLSFSESTYLKRKYPEESRPDGWIINSIFYDMYYGFYTYETDNVALIGNMFIDNIVYAIDPHDYSNNIIIAENITRGTKQRHGIIISREVNDSWIFNNTSYDNHGNGIMIDRSSVRNVIANNVSINNGGDGISIVESQDNLFFNNISMHNGNNGIRVRNSWNVTLINNNFINNGRYAIRGYSDDITDEETRDFNQDPFTQRFELTMSGGRMLDNKEGDMRLTGTDKLVLHDVSFSPEIDKVFDGEFQSFRHKTIKVLKDSKNAVEFTRGETGILSGF